MDENGPASDPRAAIDPGGPAVDLVLVAPTPGPDVRVGDFLIERRLGAGGMGVVYRARQVSLDRVVALKVLGHALNRPDDIARFRREAQAVARLDHPHIAGVHFIGQDRSLCYMAMEYVDGVSLRRLIDAMDREPRSTIDELLARTPSAEAEAPEIRFDGTTAILTPAADDPDRPGPSPGPKLLNPDQIRRAVALVRDAALALDHAHGRGVVHRDIKPENLLLDRLGQIRLIDFGVARFFEDATITGSGQIVGTPTYMSPEQVTGRVEVDHRTDIYSLGLVLYELLTLGRAVDAPTREGIFRHVVTKALPPVAGGNRAVTPALMAVVHKASAKDPDDRYQSAVAFAEDLKNVLDGRPVAAPPYRFRLDEREIDAERPKSIIGISFEFAMIAVFGVFWMLQLCALSPDARHILGYPRSAGTILGVGLGTASVVVAVAWAILTGRGWGRWAGMIGCVVWLAGCATYAAANRDELRQAGRGQVVATFGPPAITGVLALASIACLAATPAHHWFHLARRIRNEQRRRTARGG